MSKRIGWLAVSTAIALAACSSNVPPASNCEGGRCADAGGQDSGVDSGAVPVPDGGDTSDGGGDAGAEDAGNLDAGAEDGGVEDGGADAGPAWPLPPCDEACTPPRVCDPAGNGGTGACVTCTDVVGCVSPTTVCDTSFTGGLCVMCASNADCFFGMMPVCDPATRTCVGCLSGADCAAPFGSCDLTRNRCVECQQDADCSGWTPVCDVAANTCVTCLTNSDCANPNPVCDVSANTCGPCTSSASCGAAQTCLLGQCQPVPDTCAGAQQIAFTLSPTNASVWADTTTAADDDQGSCNGSAGRELVYRLTIAQTTDATLTAARPFGGAVDPVLYVRASPCASGTELGCAQTAGNAGATESVTLPALAPGDYYVFVEAAGTTAGPIILTATLSTPPPVPGNDVCSGATALAFSGGAASATGTTAGASNGNLAQSTPTCSATARQSGADVVYEFTLAQAQDVSVSVTPTGSLQPAVYVRGPQSTNTCGSDTELGCASVSKDGPVPTVALPNLAAGTYYAWVDGEQQTSGAFELDVALAAPTTNDTCASPASLSFAGGTATATGDTRFATNGNASADAAPTCSSSAKTSGRDVVYSYSLTQTRDVTITVTPTGAAPSFQPVVYVRGSSCASAATADELGCQSSFSATAQTLTLQGQAAGTYYLWVDGAQQTSGSFQLEVTLAAPAPAPSNDGCGTAQALTFTSGAASASGNTASATNSNSAGDAVPTCSTGARSVGKDVVYSYTLSQAQDVTLSVEATTSGYFPVLYVKKASCGSFAIADELACAVSGLTGTASTVLLNQPAGTYWVFVDALGSTGGAFTLDVTLAPPTPPPSNDACSGAQALSFSSNVATASGDTSTAGNSNVASDASPTCSATAKQKGRDLVYSYTLASARDVTLSVTPTGSASTYLPVAYVRGPGSTLCNSFSAGTEQGCVAQSSSAAAQMVLYNQPAGDYWLFVDGAQETSGPFGLSVTLSGPTPPPANDTCAAPTTLSIGTAVAGDTGPAKDDYSAASLPAYGSACTSSTPYPFTGRDVVYQFTATGSQHTITVTPSSTFDPAVLVLASSCGPASCTAVADAPGQGVVETVVVSTTAGQTWFVVVDHWNGAQLQSSGAFSIQVQ